MNTIIFLAVTEEQNVKIMNRLRQLPPIHNFGAVLSTSIYTTTKYFSFPYEEQIETKTEHSWLDDDIKHTKTTITSYGQTNFKKVGIFVLACSNQTNNVSAISQVLYIQEPEPSTFFGALKRHLEKRINQYSSTLFEAKVYKRDIIIGLKENHDQSKPLTVKFIVGNT